MKNYIVYLFCMIFTISNMENIFAYNYYSYEAALSDAKKLSEPLITKKERELNYQNISKEQKEYLLDCYKIEAISEKLSELDWEKAFSMEHARYVYNYYDILLNKYYKLYRNLLNADGKKALQKEERLWLKLRDTYQDEYVALLFSYAIEQPIFESAYQQIIFEQNFEQIFGIDYNSASKMGSVILGKFCQADFVAKRTDELFNYYWDYKQRRSIVNRADSYQSEWGLFDYDDLDVPIYILNTENKLNNIYREYQSSKREHLRTVNGYSRY